MWRKKLHTLKFNTFSHSLLDCLSFYPFFQLVWWMKVYHLYNINLLTLTKCFCVVCVKQKQKIASPHALYAVHFIKIYRCIRILIIISFENGIFTEPKRSTTQLVMNENDRTCNICWIFTSHHTLIVVKNFSLYAFLNILQKRAHSAFFLYRCAWHLTTIHSIS